MGTSGNIYVALVDDDENVCRSLSRLLRAAHFQAITYSSAEALLSDRKHPKFDCLILDIQMAGMSGLELSQRLAAVKINIPIIFITAFDDPEVQAKAEALGCVAYFRKTHPGEDIIAAIHKAVGLDDSDSASKL
jgi:FixJ family two-component response regulator